MSLRPSSTPPVKCSSASASFPGGLPLSFGMNLTVICALFLVVAICFSLLRSKPRRAVPSWRPGTRERGHEGAKRAQAEAARRRAIRQGRDQPGLSAGARLPARRRSRSSGGPIHLQRCSLEGSGRSDAAGPRPAEGGDRISSAWLPGNRTKGRPGRRRRRQRPGSCDVDSEEGRDTAKTLTEWRRGEAAVRPPGAPVEPLASRPEPGPKCSPQAGEPRIGVVRNSRGADVLGFLPAIYFGNVRGAQALIAKAALLDLVATHVAGPNHSALADEVVGPTRKAPAPD